MKLSLSKIIFFLTLLCSVAFAGGIDDDSGPEELSAESTNDTEWYEENFPTLITEYADLANSSDCYVKYSKGYVNDPQYVRWC